MTEFLLHEFVEELEAYDRVHIEVLHGLALDQQCQEFGIVFDRPHQGLVFQAFSQEQE